MLEHYRNRKIMHRIFVYILIAAAGILAGCSGGGKAESERMMAMYGENRVLPPQDSTAPYAVKTAGAFYVGKLTDSVVSYKGMRYAMPPVGPLRWHPPVAVPRSKVVKQAFYFGDSEIQTQGPTQMASYYKQSEDCLTLNVWTAPSDTLARARRPVMVYIHGGSYGWGGTSDPMFDGHNLVKANPDIVLVTVNYRLGIFGFLDLTNLKGGEDYKESANLGMLDQIAALRWVKENITQFGGDPGNVTIFGESAGGGSVSLLAIMDKAKGLFRRVIAQSGSVALSSSKEEAKVLTDMLVKETGIDNVGDLMKLTSEQLARINDRLAGHNRFPMRDGVLIPLDPYRSYREGKADDIEFLTGTNSDEVRYWVGEMGGYTMFGIAMNVWYENIMAKLPKEQQETYNRFTDNYPEGKTLGLAEFFNDLMFRVPSTLTAINHSEAGGKTYNYYWTYPSALPLRGACHTVELAYVFGNLDETIYTGDNINPALSATVQKMWTNFARTGNPSADGHEWPAFDAKTKKTMVLGDTIRAEEDILGAQYRLIAPLAPLYISPLYDTMSYNVPYTRAMALWAVGVIAVIIVVTVIVRRKRKKRRNR